MDLLQLKYFKDAACYVNFSKAAEINHVPQSSISKAIKALEQEYNAPLFDRIGRNVYLNDNGKFLFGEVSAIFEKLDNCSHYFDKIKPNHIIIYIQDAAFFVPLLSTDFMVCHPDTHITFSPASEVLHSVRSPYDLTFMQQTDKMDEFHYEPLLSDDFVLLVSKDHPLAQCAEVDVASLRAEKFVGFYNTMSLRQLNNKICEDFGGFYPACIFESHDEASVIHLVAINYGITLFPEKLYHVHPHPNVKIVKLKETLSNETVIAWNKRKHLSQIEQAFVDFSREWFDKWTPLT